MHISRLASLQSGYPTLNLTARSSEMEEEYEEEEEEEEEEDDEDEGSNNEKDSDASIQQPGKYSINY